MRVTNNMLANQTLFNVRRSLSSFLRIQEEMTTGRRVNKPSDDPIAVQRGLQYRTALERIEQFRTNINLGTNLLATYESSLTDMNQLVKEVVDVGLAVSNDSNNSPEAVPAFLNEVKSAIDRMLQLANSELDGRRIYAGFRTTTEPLALGPSGFSYLGDTGAMIVEIDESTDIQLNLNAAETLLQEITPIGAEADLAVGIDGATLLSELQNGLGLDLSAFTIVDDNLGLTANIDVNVPAPPVTVADLLSRINTQLTATGITNLTAAIGSDNNITLTATNNGLIGLSTPLDNLNGGSGVDLEPGLIRVTDGGAIDFEVDLSSAVTVGDAITALNAQLSAQGITNVTAALNGAGTGIDIVDSNGVPLGLSFGDVGLDSTASDLGLLGAVNPTLNGADLAPQPTFTVAEGAGQTATQLGLVGSFTIAQAGADVDALLTSATPLSRLNNGLGFALDAIAITQGTRTFRVDLSDPALVTVGDIITEINNSGADVTASINAAGTGIQILGNSATDSLIVENDGSQNSADKLGLYGAADLLGGLMLIRNELSANTGADTKVSAERVEQALRTLQAGMTRVLSARGAVGTKQNRLDAATARLANSELEKTRLLSEVEDADITELVTRLASHENNYQAGLIATAKIIQPSLMDFLR